MERIKATRVLAAVAALVIALTACGGDAESDSTASTATTTLAATSTSSASATSTTSAAEPSSNVVAMIGDREPVVRALQFLLVCNGYTRTVVDGLDKTLVPDGAYGQITANLIDSVQRDLGMPRHGDSVDPELYLRLADDCTNVRSVYLAETSLSVEAGGYAGPDHTDSWTMWAGEGQQLTLTPTDGPLTIGITDPNGQEVVPQAATEELALDVATSGNHTVTVTQDVAGPYRLKAAMPPLPAVIKLQSNGLDAIDFGASPESAITLLTAILGEPTSVTDWIESTGCLRWRRTEWGHGLWVFFTDAATAWAGNGVEHFARWRVAALDSDEPAFPRLETPSGLAVDDPADRVTEVYGDRAELTGVEISIVDGIILGELDAPDGSVAWLQAGTDFCPPDDTDE